MTEPFDNPIGVDGFEFVEFTGPDPEALKSAFEQMGFTAVARHRAKNVLRFKQGDINFILNMEPVGQPAAFRAAHGPSANAMAFRVKDAALAFGEAVRRGAKPVDSPIGPMELDIPCIEGIGGVFVYLIDRYGAQTIYDVDFKPIEGAEAREAANGLGLTNIDHLTHNVARGNMGVWADYYQRIFNFREIRHFDIEGKVTGLISRAMTSPCGKIRIPLNESKGDEGKLDQIEEFLRRYRGEGIQHIALGAADLFESVDRLRANGVALQDTPDTYYDLLDTRLPGHGHDVEALRARRILIDGNPSGGLLLQIFGKDAVGPIFFEFIQRKGDEGFGEGNFRALFESIELDQIRRGVLKAGDAA